MVDFLPKGLKLRDTNTGIYKSLLSMLAETTMFGCCTHVHLNHHDSSDPAAVLSDTGVVGMLSHYGRYQQPRDGLTLVKTQDPLVVEPLKI